MKGEVVVVEHVSRDVAERAALPPSWYRLGEDTKAAEGTSLRKEGEGANHCQGPWPPRAFRGCLDTASEIATFEAVSEAQGPPMDSSGRRGRLQKFHAHCKPPRHLQMPKIPREIRRKKYKIFLESRQDKYDICTKFLTVRPSCGLHVAL